MSTTKSPAEIIAAANAANAANAIVNSTTAATASTGTAALNLTKADTPAVEVVKSYQFPSAPTTFEFTHNSRRVAIPDGVLAVTDPKDIAELEACVRAGIVYGYIDATVTPFAAPPAPLNPNITN